VFVGAVLLAFVFERYYGCWFAREVGLRACFVLVLVATLLTTFEKFRPTTLFSIVVPIWLASRCSRAGMVDGSRCFVRTNAAILDFDRFYRMACARAR
jgi:hypothetical protein